jgi:hypothetical protein
MKPKIIEATAVQSSSLYGCREGASFARGFVKRISGWLSKKKVIKVETVFW